VWQSFLMHSGSVNQRQAPRFALFGRWGDPKAPGEEHFDFEAGPWSTSHWEFADAARSARA
jgi:predicted RecB family nuclease